MRTVQHTMHMYELGISSLSLACPKQRTDMNDAPPAIKPKRSRELALSPSPSSVVQDKMEMDEQKDLSSPAAKRQCSRTPVATDIVSTIGGKTNITAEDRQLCQQQQQQQEEAEATTVTMKCSEGQYEWWKAPATAPQLSPSRTMNSYPRNNDGSTVVGCFVCQRFFVPPIDTEMSYSPAGTSLLHFFSSSNKHNHHNQRPGLPVKRTCICTFCERNTCSQCMRQCEVCRHSFCSLCSTMAYVPGQRLEQTLCLDCASMLDLKRSSDMEGWNAVSNMWSVGLVLVNGAPSSLLCHPMFTISVIAYAMYFRWKSLEGARNHRWCPSTILEYKNK